MIIKTNNSYCFIRTSCLRNVSLKYMCSEKNIYLIRNETVRCLFTKKNITQQMKANLRNSRLHRGNKIKANDESGKIEGIWTVDDGETFLDRWNFLVFPLIFFFPCRPRSSPFTSRRIDASLQPSPPPSFLTIDHTSTFVTRFQRRSKTIVVINLSDPFESSVLFSIEGYELSLGLSSFARCFDLTRKKSHH